MILWRKSDGLPFSRFTLAAIAVLIICQAGLAENEVAGVTGKEFENSIGIALVRIDAGEFKMGAGRIPLPDELTKNHPTNGDYNEQPAHKVAISRPFYMGACEVTNAQYEQFDPEHRNLRGKLGFSKNDDEAAIFVNWHEAVKFCQWLSQKEGKPYRLPTEAEWEYACRAGTNTYFNMGNSLPQEYWKNNSLELWKGPAWYPLGSDEREAAVPLTAGLTPANAWGLRDMHGNVEEWCLDWYGPYERAPQLDPIGRAEGEFKITRGGSHSADVYFLRSASRMAALPEDKHWLIGFRIVMGDMPQTPSLPAVPLPALFQGVKQRVPWNVKRGPEPMRPYFFGPRSFAKIPSGACGPLYQRVNHDPAICVCPNGDLLAIWYSGLSEPGREVGLAGSRLRYNEKEWDEASLFWSVPNRNCHAPALWVDKGNDAIYQFCGVGAGGTWGNQALAMRISYDNGANWSKARLIDPGHGPQFPGDSNRMPAGSCFTAKNGDIILVSDAGDNSTIYISSDHGKNWADAGGRIAGIHAGVARLDDGRLLAFGRGQEIGGKIPKSISNDMGKNWTVSASEFPPIGTGQRLVLLRLREGPLFFASFVGQVPIMNGTAVYYRTSNGDNLMLIDAADKERMVAGLFAALSFDNGETWPVKKLVAPGDGRPRKLELYDGDSFIMDANTAEPLGYLAACQSPDDVIHLITSNHHYAFNLAWLEMPMPPEQ